MGQRGPIRREQYLQWTIIGSASCQGGHNSSQLMGTQARARDTRMTNQTTNLSRDNDIEQKSKYKKLDSVLTQITVRKIKSV